MFGSAVVLFSGGQDSTTCLAWALSTFSDVHTVSFSYGQRHAVELDQARVIAHEFGVPNVVLDAKVLSQLKGAALTNEAIAVETVAEPGSGNVHAAAHGLPSTFVPGRNMLFLTIAAAYGATLGIYDLVAGMCEADAAGYPDCRATFVSAAEEALTTALNEPVTIYAPLLERSKKETWLLAEELGILDVIVNSTHTCYEGNANDFHEWGFGCGLCPACVERALGFKLAFGLDAA
jgi:7-cyano-7-deazaguanine synthase